MPKKSNLTTIIALRCDPATEANLATIIESGLGKDCSAALRAAAAIASRLLTADPYIYEVSIHGQERQIFATLSAAHNHLTALGAIEFPNGDWYTPDENGDILTWYQITKIIPK